MSRTSDSHTSPPCGSSYLRLLVSDLSPPPPKAARTYVLTTIDDNPHAHDLNATLLESRQSKGHDGGAIPSIDAQKFRDRTDGTRRTTCRCCPNGGGRSRVSVDSHRRCRLAVARHKLTAPSILMTGFLVQELEGGHLQPCKSDTTSLL